MKFRALNPDEVEIRIGTCNAKGVSLLLYKDARCDMNILDETVGALNWKREHTRDNANCIVSIWNKEIGKWVSKEDTGTESFSEAEKGLASDSFKRACFNWGIGRELYTAGLIWINADKLSTHTQVQGTNKYTCKDYFTVDTFEVDEDRKVVTKLQISNKKGMVFSNLELNPSSQPKKKETPKKETPKKEVPNKEVPNKEVPKKEQLETKAAQPEVTQEKIDHSKGKTLAECKEALLKNQPLQEWLKKNNKTLDTVTEVKVREWYNSFIEKGGK